MNILELNIKWVIDSTFWFRFHFSSQGYNGKNWMIERKRNKNLLSTSTTINESNDVSEIKTLQP